MHYLLCYFNLQEDLYIYNETFNLTHQIIQAGTLQNIKSSFNHNKVRIRSEFSEIINLKMSRQAKMSATFMLRGISWLWQPSSTFSSWCQLNQGKRWEMLMLLIQKRNSTILFLKSSKSWTPFPSGSLYSPKVGNSFYNANELELHVRRVRESFQFPWVAWFWWNRWTWGWSVGLS